MSTQPSDLRLSKLNLLVNLLVGLTAWLDTDRARCSFDLETLGKDSFPRPSLKVMAVGIFQI